MELLPLWIALGAVLLFVIWFVALYNGLVRLRNFVRESWSDIDTELKRRFDLIPRLVETVKGYAKHEREVFDRVVQARNRMLEGAGHPRELAKRQNDVVGSLRGLFAVAEGYPELKANANFLQLQQELVNTEDRIQAARRFYNANVRDLNTKVEAVPTNIVAGMFGFERAEFFEVEDLDIRAAPAVNLGTTT
jgi:LemA protein